MGVIHAADNLYILMGWILAASACRRNSSTEERKYIVEYIDIYIKVNSPHDTPGDAELFWLEQGHR